MAVATKEDLDRFERNIKDHIDNKIDPIFERLEGAEECLYGKGMAPGLRINVDRLSVLAERHTWFFRATGAAFIASGFAVFTAWLKGHIGGK